jgi:fructokinase
MMLTAEELPLEALRHTRIFHFGTLSMTHPDVRFATRKAVTVAKEAGALISFDPTLRPPLWFSLDEAREQIAWGLSRCDILKIADNEIEFMTGEKDFDTAAKEFLKQRGAARRASAPHSTGASLAGRASAPRSTNDTMNRILRGI